jgi:hypothetical protein
VTSAIGERRRIYPGPDQAVIRGAVVLGAMTSVVSAQVAGARPAGWVLALLIGLTALVAARPESAAGVALLIGVAWLWSTVPDLLSPLVLAVAAGMVLVHVAATVAAQGPPNMRVDGAQARRWLVRGVLLWLAAVTVWGLDTLAADLPGGRLAYATGLMLLMVLACTATWLLAPDKN